MLPMAIVGLLVNVVAGFIMHRVSNKLLMAIGALAYCGCFAIMSAMPLNGLYWAFVFPALCLSVVGGDFQFTVTNVSQTHCHSNPLSSLFMLTIGVHESRCMWYLHFLLTTNRSPVLSSKQWFELDPALLLASKQLYTQVSARQEVISPPNSFHIEGYGGFRWELLEQGCSYFLS